MKKMLIFVLMGVASLTAQIAGAAGADTYVPEELIPWQEWVLEGKEYRDCPFFFNADGPERSNFVCAWPSQLEISVDGNGGTFEQGWTVYAKDEWIPLPGDATNWPQQVQVDNQTVTVIARGDTPSIRLAPGEYNVSGMYEWNERPRTLRIPTQSGLLNLEIDGEVIVRPERNGQTVWLGEREQERKVEDALQVQVYRLVADDVPLRLVTILRIEASGSVREELIGPALPTGFVPMLIESELPTRLEPDGNLRLQIRPGSWELALVARADDVVNSVALPEPQSNLPPTEIWSYQTNDELRVTVPEGLVPVDPLQVNVPLDWEELPSFRVDAGDTLTIAERSRGKVAAENQLTLQRQFWLDFDGQGYVFSDAINGTMRTGWRLDMKEPYGLFSAAEGEDNLLVTIAEESGLAGIEVRQPNLFIQAVGRTESRGELPVSGWQTRFNQIDTTVHLPPGNKLLAVVGADSASMSWVNRWQLLDFFLVLITSIAAARLFGREIGVLSLFALTLSLHEPNAPEFIWINLLVAVALARVAPAGRLLQASKTYRNLSVVALLFIFVPFAANQLRIAIYPQLESQRTAGDYMLSRSNQQANLFGAGDPALMTRMEADVIGSAQMASAMPRSRSQAIEEITVSASKMSRDFSRYASNAIVQVGPGRPAWQWNSYRLSWAGPVDAERSMRLIVMPRWLVTGLRFIEVMLLGALIAVFVFEISGKKPPWRELLSGLRRWTNPGAATTTAILVATMMAAGAPNAVADTPSDTVLKQLEQRLLEAPPCAPRCAEIVDVTVSINSDELEMRLIANSLENVAVPLPGSLQGWRPEQVSIDNVPVAEVYRSGNQALWVRVPEGQRIIELRGPLPPVDSLEIPFPTRPRVITVDTTDWFVAGIQDKRLLSGSLQLTRLQQQADGESTARWESSRFPVFTRIERTIDLDLDWRVSTTVYRVAPEQGAINISIPLLADESVTTEDLTVTDGEILISMNPNQDSVTWQSTLPRQSPLSLEAQTGMPWKEVWSFGIGSIWHVSFNGVPESESGEAAMNYRVAQFYPRAGETLEIDVNRPAATSGDTIVFDSVTTSTNVGDRSSDSTLQLSYRSTRGSQHTIKLPDDAEVTMVVIDGVVAPLRAENGELRIPILPGVHSVSVQWRNADASSFRNDVPRVDLGAGASNIHATLSVPGNRWVIAAFGPKLGPSVLYWSELLVMILIALILGRLNMTPLKTKHWLLLGLGFSTFSWYALGLVVVWLVATDVQRKFKEPLLGWRYNFVQVVMGILAVAALLTIVVSLPTGLLGSPDMHIVGNGSYGNTLRWFDDRSVALIPTAFVLSLPIWIYKALILAWALWLSFALLRWLPWVWREYVADILWKPRVKKVPVIDEA